MLRFPISSPKNTELSRMISKARLEKIRELSKYDMPGIYAELLDEIESLRELACAGCTYDGRHTCQE